MSPTAGDIQGCQFAIRRSVAFSNRSSLDSVPVNQLPVVGYRDDLDSQDWMIADPCEDRRLQQAEFPVGVLIDPFRSFCHRQHFGGKTHKYMHTDIQADRQTNMQVDIQRDRSTDSFRKSQRTRECENDK
eukprot:GHVU01053760.1.p1 GENE.GHVU01053760.1~~GHVU01053760.1.p1  ORF type:complete len:130 (-),score=6.98 GHVU01053760.1:337-726(-)